MLRSADGLKGYVLGAADGDLGDTVDFLFDDELWTIRYLVADTGTWLPGRKVLITPAAVEDAVWSQRRLHVGLTKEQIKDSPGVDTDRPVSRQYEQSYYNYYGWPYYWGVGGPRGISPTTPQGAQVSGETLQTSAPEGDSHLHSLSEVLGYRIKGVDDEIGHVEDLIVDDENWRVQLIVVDTKNWWFGRKVLISPDWIKNIDWFDRSVEVGHTKEQIKNSPEWDPTAPVNAEYVEELYDYYGRRTVP